MHPIAWDLSYPISVAPGADIYLITTAATLGHTTALSRYHFYLSSGLRSLFQSGERVQEEEELWRYLQGDFLVKEFQCPLLAQGKGII